MSDIIDVTDIEGVGSADSWSVVTDDVMGGLSVGAIAIEPGGVALFSGAVSLENNGGFSSVRFVGPLPELNRYRGLRISVQGDGKKYQLRTKAESAPEGYGYKCDFATTAGEWLEVELPFSEFAASNHGRPDPEAGALDPSEIHQLSILIAGGQAGEFALRVRSLAAYS